MPLRCAVLFSRPDRTQQPPFHEQFLKHPVSNLGMVPSQDASGRFRVVGGKKARTIDLAFHQPNGGPTGAFDWDMDGAVGNGTNRLIVA
jgi:hypothetical protein